MFRGKTVPPGATRLRKQTEKRMVEKSPTPQATALPEVSCGFPVCVVAMEENSRPASSIL